MRDTQVPSVGPTGKTRIRLRVSVFDDLAAQKGACTVAEQVAMTGVSRPSLYRIRAGHPPSLPNAMRIAAALDVSMDVLFERVKVAV